MRLDTMNISAPSVLGRTNLHTLHSKRPTKRSIGQNSALRGGRRGGEKVMLQVKTSVELSGKREVCSFRRNSTRMALQWSAELEQLLAQAISELYPVGSWERRG